MIITSIITINDIQYRKTISDCNFKIRQVGTGKIYDDTIDVQNFTYEETTIPIRAEPATIEQMTVNTE